MKISDSGTKPRRSAAAQGVFVALACLAGNVLGQQALAQSPSSARAASPSIVNASDAEAWRAMTRLGYGPSPSLIRNLQAAPDARTWALQQVDAAHTASQQAPRIAPDLAAFNAPLPTLFEGGQRERQARVNIKTNAKPDNDSPGARRMDFSAPPEPEHFSRTMVQQAAAWRLGSCSLSDEENPLLARMTEFWFNHLNVYVGKGAVRPFAGHYVVNVARTHALGRFEDLLLASARHPAMLLYLDQARSVAEGSSGPQGSSRGLNENYARELMELHTLGVDSGYTQADVRELARVLTGWTVAPRETSGFQFVPRLHDTRSKQVLGTRFPTELNRTGEREGEDAIRMLARHPATAHRVSLRLAQFFVADRPAPELVERLSRIFLSTRGDLRAVMRTLLESADFWQPQNRLFKTPLDFACSALAATQAATHGSSDRRSLLQTLGFLANAGQPLHGWQTPDGYKVDTATWLVPEALTRRTDFALSLGRQSPDLDFLRPYLGANTLAAIAQERPALRAGLMLASPDFMYK